MYFSELKDLKCFDSCERYLDDENGCNRHIETTKHTNNIRQIDGENEDSFQCIACRTNPSNSSVKGHLRKQRNASALVVV